MSPSSSSNLPAGPAGPQPGGEKPQTPPEGADPQLAGSGQHGGPDSTQPQVDPAEPVQRFINFWQQLLADQVSPLRLASHVALLLIATLVLVLSQVDLPQWQVVRLAPASPEATAALPEPAFEQEAIGGSMLQESGALMRAAVPFTEIPDRPRLDVITYTVKVDDTVLGIAEQFGLNPNTIVWSNQEFTDNPFLMAVGQVLYILPMDGVYHRVKEGDTIRDIAEEYKVEPQEIVAFEGNGLEGIDSPLTVGQYVVVPDGDRTPPEPPASQGPVAPWRAEDFMWPAYGRLTQGYWLPAHPAIDIGAPLGAQVRAADAGRVVDAGWSDYGYGNYVVVAHYDGFRTLYAHLNRIDVSSGQEVVRGQQIGTVGSTGRSTGPHLHFEVSMGGRTYSPFLYLQ